MKKAIDTFKNLGDLVENVSLYFSDDDLRKMVLLDPGLRSSFKSTIYVCLGILLENAEHIKATARIFYMHDFTLVESKGTRLTILFPFVTGFPGSFQSPQKPSQLRILVV